MTTRLTPEQEAAIEEFLKTRQHIAGPGSVLRAAYPAHVSALLAEISALRDEVAAANSYSTAIEEALQRERADNGELLKELDSAKALLVWSDESPTEPGFYWWRDAPGGDVDVAKVEVANWGIAWFSIMENEPSSLRSKSHFGQWAGPLSPPETEP